MMNQFRRHPKVSGWLYTELHDVINEWNGYYRFDRSEKVTGLGFVRAGNVRRGPPRASLPVPGRRPVPGREAERDRCGGRSSPRSSQSGPRERAWSSGPSSTDGTRSAGARPTSARSGAWPSSPGWRGRFRRSGSRCRTSPRWPSRHHARERGGCRAPSQFHDVPRGRRTVAALGDPQGGSGELRVVRFAPDTFTSARWSLKQWNVLGGLKVDGAGHGCFEYRLPWPAGLDPEAVSGASLMLEASAKQLFGKGRDSTTPAGGDCHARAEQPRSQRNPNTYPMTGTAAYPSEVRVRTNGIAGGSFWLPDNRPTIRRPVLACATARYATS